MYKIRGERQKPNFVVIPIKDVARYNTTCSESKLYLCKGNDQGYQFHFK